jgi:SLT domain-containing protein
MSVSVGDLYATLGIKDELTAKLGRADHELDNFQKHLTQTGERAQIIAKEISNSNEKWVDSLSRLSEGFKNLGVEKATEDMKRLAQSFAIGSDIEPTVAQIRSVGQEIDRLRAAGAEVSPSLQDVYRRFQEMGASAESTLDPLESMKSKLLQLAAGWVSFQAIRSVISDTTEFGSRMTDLAARVGQSTDSLQRMAYAADQNGSSAEQLAMSMARLTRGVESGQRSVTNAVDKLGLSLTHLKSLEPEKQFETMLIALSQLPRATERTSIAMELFGRGGAALVPVAQQLGALTEEANRLGVVVSATTIKAADDFGDAQTSFSKVVQAFKADFAAELLPTLTSGLKAVTEILAEVKNGFETLPESLRELIVAAGLATAGFFALQGAMAGLGALGLAQIPMLAGAISALGVATGATVAIAATWVAAWKFGEWISESRGVSSVIQHWGELFGIVDSKAEATLRKIESEVARSNAAILEARRTAETGSGLDIGELSEAQIKHMENRLKMSELLHKAETRLGEELIKSSQAADKITQAYQLSVYQAERQHEAVKMRLSTELAIKKLTDDDYFQQLKMAEAEYRSTVALAKRVLELAQEKELRASIVKFVKEQEAVETKLAALAAKSSEARNVLQEKFDLPAIEAQTNAIKRKYEALKKEAEALYKTAYEASNTTPEMERLLAVTLANYDASMALELALGKEAQGLKSIKSEAKEATDRLAEQLDKYYAKMGRGFGEQLLEGLGNSLTKLPGVIQSAIQGGGNVGAAIGASLGADIGQSLGTKLGGMLGSMGKFLGPLGAIAGSLAGKWLGGLFGEKEVSKVNKMRDAFLATSGGLKDLEKRAEAAGTNLSKLFNARTVEAYQKAVAELDAQLQEWSKIQTEAQQKLNDAIDRYGFSIAELGPTFREQRLNEMAASLLEDYHLLTAAGIEHNLVTARMTPALLEYIDLARQSGGQIPLAMQPIIDSMIEQGLLLDENGTAYTSAEEAGLSYTATMTEQFQKLIEKINDLVNALLGVGRAAPGPINIPINPVWGEPDRSNTPWRGRDEEDIGLAEGGIVTRRQWKLVGEKGPEAVIPLDRLDFLLKPSGSSGASSNGEVPFHVEVHVGPEKLYDHLFSASRGRLLRIHEDAIVRGRR